MEDKVGGRLEVTGSSFYISFHISDTSFASSRTSYNVSVWLWDHVCDCYVSCMLFHILMMSCTGELQ